MSNLWISHACIIHAIRFAFRRSPHCFCFPRNVVYKPQRDRYPAGAHAEGTMPSESLRVFNLPNVSHVLGPLAYSRRNVRLEPLTDVCLSGVVVCHRRNVRFEFYTDVSSGILTYCRRIVRFEYFTEVFLGVRRCRRRNVRFASLTDVTAGIVVYCRTTLVFHLVQASV